MKKHTIGLLIAILVGFGLRFYNLTYHSLWFDEAMSVHWARQSALKIIEVGLTLVEDRLPPLYYLGLKGWTGMFGFSEVSVRSLSVFVGVLLIPLTAKIAAILFDRRVALVTAWLIAFNPFLIWYAQEARMYAPAALFSALTVWAFIRFTEPANRQPGPGPSRRIVYLFLFTLFAIAGLYTHLYTGFILPALGLWLLISRPPGSRRLWLLFALSGLVITLAFTPLAVATWRFSGEAVPGEPLRGLGQRAWWLLQAFIVWKAPLPPGLQTGLPLIAIAFAAAALLPLFIPHRFGSRLHLHAPRFKFPLLLLALLLLCPFFIATLLLYRNHLAFFGARYFIVMVPWLLLLLAAGAVNWSRYLSETIGIQRGGARLIEGVVPLTLLLATALPAPGQWSVAAAKEAWRQSAAYLAGRAAPDHGILIHPDWVRYPFQFYFEGPGQTYAAFSNVRADTYLDGPLQGVVDDHPVIWLIQSHLDGPDPARLVEQWFAARYPLVTELYPPGISLLAYAPGYRSKGLPPEATPADILFEPGLRLVGYQSDRAVSARDELFHPPSGWVHVVLYWTAQQPIAGDLRPFVHLVGPEGVWGASLERTNDALSLYPTSRWPASGSTVIRHDLDVNLNPATPPGRYRLVVGLPGHEQTYPLAEIEVN